MLAPHRVLPLAAVALVVGAAGCSLVGDEPPDVLVVGDSVTELSRQELGEEMDDWAGELIVRARSGATTAQLVPLAEDGLTKEPDVGVFLPGYNDVLRGRADAPALDDMIELAADLPCAVWLLLPTDGGYDPEQVERWNARLEQAADEHPSIHLSSDWKRLVEESPTFTFLSERDAIHPNAEGQRAIAEVMSAEAREACG